MEDKYIMMQWDYWRKRIAEGDTSCAPDNWFKSVIESIKEDSKEIQIIPAWTARLI